MKQRELQKMQTRKKIFDCAMQLFSERSYEDVKITDIVEMANVSVGTFYFHFPSKDDIIDEGFRQFDQKLEDIFQKENPQPGYETILFLIRNQLEDVREKGPDCTGIFFKNMLGVSHDYFFSESRFLYYQLLQTVGSCGFSEKKTLEITEGILRISRGTIYDWCLHSGKYDIVQVGMEDVKMYLNAIDSSLFS
jgi:hypothetical protein